MRSFWQINSPLLWGVVGFLLAVGCVQPPLTATILFWAVLVLTPLALALGEQEFPETSDSQITPGWTSIWRWLAASSLATAFALPQGIWGAALAVGWLLVTLQMGWQGFRRTLRSKFCCSPQLVFDLGKIYVVIGGAFVLISRCGARPLDFSDEIILLTAVHFHFAGLFLPLLAAVLYKQRPNPFTRTAGAGIVVAVPLLAVGITCSPWLEIATAVVLAGCCLVLAEEQVRFAVAEKRPRLFLLMSVSAASLAGAMGLAVAYAWGEFTETRWLAIPTMVRTHGLANAFGFVTCALWGWANRRGDSRP